MAGSSVAPATDAAVVTPNDSTDLSCPTRALWVGGAGNLAVNMYGGQTITLNGVPAGTLLPVTVTRVRATNTTATNIVALW